MKNWIKKIGQNKFQFFFFVGVVCLMFAAIIIGSLNNNKQIEQPNDDTTVTPNPTPDDEGVGNISDEFVSMPFDATLEYDVVRKFYEKDASIEDQTKSLIKYQNSFRTSTGTSFALKSGEYFDVVSSIAGTVTEVSNSPLFGNYVVVSNDEDVKTYYYGLSEVCVEKGIYIELNGTRINFTKKEINDMIDVGVKFIINSDAHSPLAVGKNHRGFNLVEKYKIPLNQIANINNRIPEFK